MPAMFVTMPGPVPRPSWGYPWNIQSMWNFIYIYMGVSVNGGTPKSSILIGFSFINHPFWGTTIFGNINIDDTV